VLSVKNLSKSYNSHQTVLQDISFDLHSGEMVGVIGRSGAGKSTLLHVLNGTHSATSGEILSFPDVGYRATFPALKAANSVSGAASAG
jgi:phosphonate transport system ATP-binding protein